MQHLPRIAIDKRVEKILHTVFKIDAVNMQTSIDSVDAWDSLGHMKLVAAIEQEFSLSFSFHEITELTSVEKILSCLEKKSIL